MTTPSAQTQQQPGFEMTIPGQVSNRRDNIQLLEQGPNVGILYSMIDLGTHYNEHFQKSSRVLRLTFEFPLLKQLFRTDDTETRPTVVSVEHTFQMAERSNLKKFVDGALGRILQPHEYKDGYSIGQFLGKTMIVNIGHQPSKKDPSKIYERIQTVQGLTEHVRSSYSFDWSLVRRTNELQGFLIDPQGLCFQSDQFAKLPKFIREKIQAGDEAKAYAANGGQFVAQAEYNNTSPVQGNPQATSNAPAPVQRVAQAPSPTASNIVVGQDGKQLEWLNKDFTYETMKANGWGDIGLIENGYCKLHVPVQAPAPPAPPSAPAPPQAPQAPQAPAPPSASFDADADGIAF
jgi:hypothetical protein